MDLAVIGADGFDPRIANYYLTKGHLPNLKELRERGEFGGLASRLEGHEEPQTGPAWTTIYTGLRAAQHNVTQGGWHEGDVSLRPHFDQSIFAELADLELSVGSFTMPITFPAVAREGSWMVSGFPATRVSDKIVAPTDVLSYLPDGFGDLQARALLNAPGEQSSSISDWVEAEDRKLEVLDTILEDYEADVLFYGSQITDVVGHRVGYYPPKLNGLVRRLAGSISGLLSTELIPPRMGTKVWHPEVKAAYQQMDAIVGHLVENYDPNDILLVSDHGFQLAETNHAFVGTSIATGGIPRPESILEVKECILESRQNEWENETIDRSDAALSDEDVQGVREQLDSLGYL